MSPAGDGLVVFAAESLPLVVTCILGEDNAPLAGGVGGFDDVERPGRRNTIEFGSTPALTMSVPILFDGLAQRLSVEPSIAVLRALGAPPRGSPRGTRPPVVKVAGMVPHGNRRWVITDISEDDAIWSSGKRVRYFATVALTQWLPPDLVVVRSKKKQRTKQYTVRKGDTLASIAKRQMGAKTPKVLAKAIRELKAANKLRSSAQLKKLVGKKIKIPIT